MRARWFPCLTLLGLLLVPAAARPADANKKDTTPTVVVRVRSIDTVVENAKFLATLAGKEEVGKQVEALIKTKVGPKGLEGIDTRKPIGVYTKIGEDPSESAGVVMIPIADEKAFLGLLENLNVKAEKNNEGLYTVQQDAVPVQVVFRFAHGYAYVTALNVQAIDKANLIAPAQMFPRNLTADISGSVRLDQLPKAAKELVLSRMEDEIAKAKDRREPGETEAQQKFRAVALDAFYRRASDVLRNGREVAGLLNINRDKKDLVVELSLDAAPDSTLSKDIRLLAEGKSLFAGLAGKDAAMAAVLHAALPKDLNKALGAAIEDGAARGLEKEKDRAKRAQMEKFLDAIRPTLRSGSLDAGFALRGPSAARRYTFVAGIKLKEGTAIEKSIRDALENVGAEEKARIKLDADSVGDVKIHRIEAQQGFDKGAKEMFGDNPVYIAFREDAMLVGLGEDGLAALKEAIPQTAQGSPPLLIELSVARVAKTLAKTEDQKKAVQDAFAGGDAGLMRLTLEGGSALRLRFTTDLSVLQFGALFNVTNQARVESQK